MPNHTQHLPFFNAEHLPAASPSYVAWIDVMGIQGTMSRSLRVSANFIFKLHIAARECAGAQVHLYPVMDGVYCVSGNQIEILAFLKELFARLADIFVSTTEMQHRFAVKGALAFGPVVHGNSLPPAASQTLADNTAHRNAVFLGMPVIQAFLGERKAPPFGLYVDDSARAFAPDTSDPLNYSWWTWFRVGGQWAQLAQELRDELNNYYDWCANRSQKIGYESDRIKVHRELAQQYFADLPP